MNKRIKNTILFLILFFHFQAYSQTESAKANQIVKGLKGKLIQTPEFIAQLSELNTDWQILHTNIINPFDEWLTQQNFTFKNSTHTVYYPFGGPDFLFPQVIYPKAEKYMLAGLENIGTLPSLDINKPEDWVNYLKQLNQALRYLHKAGYFVTEQMTEDFKQSELDGVIHLFLLFLAQHDNQIEQIENLCLNEKGELINCLPAKANVLRIVYQTNEKITKELLYFKQNLANQALNNHTVYEKFLSKQKPFHTYMKSASFVLFDKEFSKHRDFILTQSTDILQDDSGIPLAELQKYFGVDIFGKYTGTTKSFPYGYQDNLKKLAENNKALPFKIGYNQWIEETVLLYAHGNPQSVAQEKPAQTISANKPYKFGVQIAALSIPLTNKKLKTLEMKPIEIREDKMFKYIIGYFDTYEECKEYKNKISKTDFPEAFIVVYKNNERISTKQYFSEISKSRH